MGSTTIQSLMSLTAPLLCLIMMIHSTPAQSLTAYEILENYNLPAGLLPEGVEGYDLDNSTGKFLVYFTETCTFSISSYQLKYNTTVQGYISNGKISSLKGVSVKILSAWLSIVKIYRQDDDLRFSVGIASASFSTDKFATSPQCG